MTITELENLMYKARSFYNNSRGNKCDAFVSYAIESIELYADIAASDGYEKMSARIRSLADDLRK